MCTLEINEVVTSSRLADSRTNHVKLHLFQVMRPGEYTYGGLVKFAA